MGAFEYSGVMESYCVSGDVKLTVGGCGLSAAALFDSAELLYSDILRFDLVDWTVYIQTVYGQVKIFRLGSFCAAFFEELRAAYVKKTIEALFVEGAPILEVKGEYRIEEAGEPLSGAAEFRVYENCVCILPNCEAARRVPFCFVTGMNKSNFELTLSLVTGERYCFIRMGYDTRVFEECVEKQLRALREKTVSAIKKLDDSIPPAQAAAVARLIPEGVAAPMGQLSAAAPSFARAVEAKIAGSRAAGSYDVFRRMLGSAPVCVGIKEKFAFSGAPSSDNEGDSDGEHPLGLLDGNNAMPTAMPELTSEAEDPGAAEDDPFMLWMIAPGADGHSCAVEFAVDEGESAATYVYRFDCRWEAFRSALNMAMEGSGFRRDAVRLDDSELALPKNDTYKMAVRRSAALRYVRGCLAGRVIHSSPERWERELLRYLGGA